MDRKTKPIWFMQYLFLKQDRINCYSFFNEISKRIFVYPIYNFGCYRSSYHGVFPTFWADRFQVTKHLLSLINFTILGFQQEVLMGVWWHVSLVIFCGHVRLRFCGYCLYVEHSGMQQKTTMWLFMAKSFVGNILSWCFCLPALRSHCFCCSLLQKKDLGMGEVRSDNVNAVCFLRSLHETILTKHQSFEHW